ncbi:MAG: heavy metal translocating P-type ATPase [Planctomycetota bacterium]
MSEHPAADPETPAPPTLDVAVRGMHCAACAASVARALESVAGTERADVSFATARARVRGSATLPALRAALRRAGYDVATRTLDVPADMETDLRELPWVLGTSPAGEGRVQVEVADLPEALEAVRARLPEDEAAFRSTGDVPAWKRELAGARARALLAVPLAWLAMGAPPWTLPGHGLVALTASVVLVLGVGCGFHLRAFAAARRGRADMDTLVSVGTLVALGAGLVAHLRGVHGDQLHAAAMITALVLVGRWLEARTRRELGDAVEGLARLEPDRAELLREGAAESVAVHRLMPGDLVRVRPGTRVPADGVVRVGTSDLDTSALTGESVPREVGPGDEVLAGSRAGRGALEIEILRAAEDSVLRRMRAWVREAESRPAAVARLADRVAGVFVPIVLGLAALTFCGWWALGDADGAAKGLVAAVAVLVVACPCALGLATPTAITAGVGRAARLGVLLRGGDVLEHLAEVQQVVFDKTGTLTEGRPRVVGWAPWARGGAPGAWQEGAPQGQDLDARSARALAAAAAVEAAASHPLAEAVLQAAKAAGLEIPAVEQATTTPGVGAEGRVASARVRVGSLAALAPEAPPPWLAEADAKGRGIVVVEMDRKPALALAWQDAPRPSAHGAVEAVRARGYRVVLLSGDREASARAAANALGIDEVEAPVLPTAKAERVRALQQVAGPVLMVGDGINDAPALGEAAVGLAVAGATDVAAAAADAALVDADLGRLPELLDLAQATRRVILQNLALAFGYNAAMLPLAALGQVPPRIAAGAMALSSLSVVGNALRLGRGGRRGRGTRA